MTGPDWPSHAYVPGRTSRHPENAFSEIRATARPGMGPNELYGTEAFLSGLRYLEGGYYWEAHEVLEPVWMALPAGSADRRFVQGLIQLANGFLKLRMGRPRAARRLYLIARDLLCATGSVTGPAEERAQGWLLALEAAIGDEVYCISPQKRS